MKSNLLLALVGAGLAAYGAIQLWPAVRPRLWPAVPGVVTASALTMSTRAAEQVDDNEQESTTYGVQVRFKYQVDGQWRQGESEPGPHLCRDNLEDAQALLAEYPVNGEVRVRCAANRPHAAVLEQPLTWRQSKYALLGLALIVVAVVTIPPKPKLHLCDPTGAPFGTTKPGSP